MKLLLSCLVIAGLNSCFYCAVPTFLYENDSCKNQDQIGICTRVLNCTEANDSVNQVGYHNFARCGFAGKTEIVCCPLSTPTRLVNITNSLRRCEEECNKYLKMGAEIGIVVPQIAGGEPVVRGEFPSICALGLYSNITLNYLFKCGGTLISEKYVITAAHCTFDKGDEVKIVRLGVINVPESVEKIDPNIDFKVKNYTVHPEYRPLRRLNDIALVLLEKSVVFRNELYPSCLFLNTNNYPRELIIAGWGEVEPTKNKTTTLQKAVVNFEPHQTCAKKFKHFNELRQLCTLHNISDTCQGDSGGPLYERGANGVVLVGVTNYGQSGCFGGGPAVYASIPKYLDWIEKIVWA